MDELINKQAAIDAVNCVMVMKGIRSGKSITAEAVDCAKRIIADNIRQLPPAELPRIRGQWSIKGQAIDTVRGYWAKCSACGHSVFGGGNYCSYCGSYNKGEVIT